MQTLYCFLLFLINDVIVVLNKELEREYVHPYILTTYLLKTLRFFKLIKNLTRRIRRSIETKLI